jgi:hypothetical protein
MPYAVCTEPIRRRNLGAAQIIAEPALPVPNGAPLPLDWLFAVDDSYLTDKSTNT